MRTTLTIDDDVAVQLEKLRREKNIPFREVVNDTLRRGLTPIHNRPVKARFETKTADVGKFLIPMLDCYGEMLDFIEEAERRADHRR